MVLVNQTTKKMKSLHSLTALSSEDSNVSVVIDNADLIDHTDSLQKTKENWEKEMRMPGRQRTDLKDLAKEYSCQK